MYTHHYVLGFPRGSDVKEYVCNAGDLGSLPGSGRSPGEGNGNPLQYSCLENSMDRGAWRATVYGVSKSQDPKSTSLYIKYPVMNRSKPLPPREKKTGGGMCPESRETQGLAGGTAWRHCRQEGM